MAEKIVDTVQRFMHFYTTQWAILSSLFHADAALYSLQGVSSPELQIQLAKAHADINDTLGLAISTFNRIISKLSEQREISIDAFEFLRDDLDRATNVANQLAEVIKSGYGEAARSHLAILQTKLIEIDEKVSRHLEKRER